MFDVLKKASNPNAVQVLQCPMCVSKKAKKVVKPPCKVACWAFHDPHHGITQMANASMYTGGKGGLPEPAFRHGLEAQANQGL